MLGLTTLKVALHRAKGTPLPRAWPGSTSSSSGRLADSTSARATSCRRARSKIVSAGDLSIGVYNCGGELYAIEDRCSHDDGPLCEGDWDPGAASSSALATAPTFDLRTGEALTLPAYQPVETFPVRVEDGMVKVEIV